MSLGAVLALSISAAGVGIALATLIKAYAEYAQQGRQRRAEMFFSLRERLKGENLGRIAELIDLTESRHSSEAEEAERELAKIPLRQKRDYVGLFEEVAIFMDKGQIEPELAHYMFGYYALMCEECLAFWNNINYDSVYWSIFHEFCAAMRTLRDELSERHGSTDPPKGAVYIDEAGGRNGGSRLKVTVNIATQLRGATNGDSEVEVAGSTAGEVLDAVFDAHGELRKRISRDGDLLPFVNVYVADQDIRFQQGLETAINEGDEVTILPAVAGG